MSWETILIAVITSGIFTTALNFIFEKYRNDREIEKYKKQTSFQDKLAIYRMIIDLMADFLNDLDLYLVHGKPIPEQKIYLFNNMRMRTFGYLCIYANQKSIDAHERLIEYIYEVLEGQSKGEWPEVRERAMALLNSFRSDYDAALPDATYNGNR